MNYSTFLQTHIFPAAGMKHARVDYPVDAKGMARAFDEEGKTVPYAQQTKGWVRLPVRDLYKWMITLDAGKVIPASALRELGRNFPGGESSLGTTSFNDDALISHQHQGSNSNYEAAFYHNAKDGISIVMMTNNQQMNVWPLKTAIVHILQNEPFTIPKKSLYLSIRDKILADFSKGMEYYHSLKSTGQQSYDFSFEIGDLISTAKYLQRRGRFDDAISILKAAVVLDAKAQDRSYGYELMGECYEKKGNTSLALESLQTAVSLYPENKNAAGMMLRLKNN